MVIYDERLSVPVRWWLAATAAAAGLAAALLPVGPLPAAAGGALLLAVTAWALRGYGAVRIRVCDGVLVAGQIVLRAEHFGGIEVLDEAEALAWRTRRAGPRARLLMRGFLPQAVRVDIVDPSLLCPFVYLSTRRPAELAGALADARARYGVRTAA
ncbi:DUF3093 domain-containing protein [Kitasatospora sp. DSM 101779]|uniref:DUF3093 domain-containing protein n=1 Tax=Kitasatospora sp. DSM 101779 TaxID=2853165 RepID=UPI0021DAFF66|nr:DUF3093 domain-containing protein [Kitasatospora sp. DSM 101779]MCU7821274.1 DUF3093 domain-containing protein [Kitasatospora sp. DSM 101779]